MSFRKLFVNVIPTTCVTAMLLSAVAMGETAKNVKTDTVKNAAGAKQLKPQTTCPVQGDPINKKLFVDYQGKRIYVCCAGCLDQVKANPEKYIKKLESMGQGVESLAAVTKKESKDTQVAGYWTCPMHPEVHQSGPGKCPICGMNLEFKKSFKDTVTVKGTDMKGMKM